MNNGDKPAQPYHGPWKTMIEEPHEPGVVCQSWGTEDFSGLTKREWFAGMAMQALITKNTGAIGPASLYTSLAVDFAEELIKKLGE